MKTITVAMLKKAHACSEQVDLFRDTFGESAALTKANWQKAIDADLSVDWLTELLDAPAWAEYEKVNGPALAEYQKVNGPAWAEYEKVNGAAWAEYEKVNGPAYAEYEKVRGAAYAEYEKVRGAALFKALRGMAVPA